MYDGTCRFESGWHGIFHPVRLLRGRILETEQGGIQWAEISCASYCLNTEASPRLYPKSEQVVNPHLPPIERMPVPVTPFPKLFRDDPEPA